MPDGVSTVDWFGAAPGAADPGAGRFPGGRPGPDVPYFGATPPDRPTPPRGVEPDPFADLRAPGRYAPEPPGPRQPGHYADSVGRDGNPESPASGRDDWPTAGGDWFAPPADDAGPATAAQPRYRDEPDPAGAPPPRYTGEPDRYPAGPDRYANGSDQPAGGSDRYAGRVDHDAGGPGRYASEPDADRYGDRWSGDSDRYPEPADQYDAAPYGPGPGEPYGAEPHPADRYAAAPADAADRYAVPADRADAQPDRYDPRPGPDPYQPADPYRADPYRTDPHQAAGPYGPPPAAEPADDPDGDRPAPGHPLDDPYGGRAAAAHPAGVAHGEAGDPYRGQPDPRDAEPDGWPASPPAAGPAGTDAAAPGSPEPVPPDRAAAAVNAVLAVVVFGALIAAGRLGPPVDLAACALVQVALVLSWVFGTRRPGPVVVAVVALGAGFVADWFAQYGAAVSLAPFGYVLAGGLLAAAAGQLARGGGRTRITDSLASTMFAVTCTVAVPAVVMLARLDQGPSAVVPLLGAAGAAVVLARLVDLVWHAPRASAPVARGVIGVVAGGVVAGTVVGFVAGQLADLPGLHAAVGGLLMGLAAVLADVGVSFGSSGRELSGEPAHRWPARFVLGPAVAAALVAPVAFVLGWLVLLPPQ
jgi:hypothetical protein